MNNINIEFKVPVKQRDYFTMCIEFIEEKYLKMKEKLLKTGEYSEKELRLGNTVYRYLDRIDGARKRFDYSTVKTKHLTIHKDIISANHAFNTRFGRQLFFATSDVLTIDMNIGIARVYGKPMNFLFDYSYAIGFSDEQYINFLTELATDIDYAFGRYYEWAETV